MSDVTPNYSLEVQGMELEQAQLLLNVKSQTYRIAQSNDEIARIQANIEATQIAITSITDRIAGLKGA